MDLMARRKVLLASGKKDYLKGVEWVEGRFIQANGGTYSNASCHYTENVIFLPQGIFVLKGKNGSSNINYRIHEYDENGKFITQITVQDYRANNDVNLQFTAPQAPHGIKLSIASAFVGTLTKA